MKPPGLSHSRRQAKRRPSDFKDFPNDAGLVVAEVNGLCGGFAYSLSTLHSPIADLEDPSAFSVIDSAKCKGMFQIGDRRMQSADPQSHETVISPLYKANENFGKQEKPSRSDDDVMRTFRDPLAQRQVLSRLTKKRITGKDDEYEFPYAWKNGRWNACEPVSLDLVESGSIIDKANRWLGRAHNLQASEENFKLFLLLGKPSASGPLMDAFHRAERILGKIPIDHELVLEEDASRFATQVEADLREHDEQ